MALSDPVQSKGSFFMVRIPLEEDHIATEVGRKAKFSNRRASA